MRVPLDVQLAACHAVATCPADKEDRQSAATADVGDPLRRRNAIRSRRRRLMDRS